MMKSLLRHIIPGFLLVLASWNVRSQELPEILQRILQTDTSYTSISCHINIKVEVPGLNMPEKEVELSLEKGKQPKIKSKGLTVVPKRGIIGQYREFLDLACQAIPIREDRDTIVYKVVSLDKKTDWVTVDVTITQSDAKVHSLLISTRKNGEYLVQHKYGAGTIVFPEQTVISFEAMPLKLPLKFMGQQDRSDPQLNQDGPVNGKVILQYSDIVLK